MRPLVPLVPLALALSCVAPLSGCVRGGRVVKPPVTVAPPSVLPEDRAAPEPPPAPLVGGDALPLFRDFVGKAPPELSRSGRWVRADPTLSLAALRGRVVVLHFAFLKCPGCETVLPWLARWRARYAAEGVSVVYVDNGRRDTLAEVEAAARAGTLPTAIRYDASEATTIAYGVRAYPTTYVLDRRGVVTWNGVSVGAEAAVEAAIVAALAR